MVQARFASPDSAKIEHGFPAPLSLPTNSLNTQENHATPSYCFNAKKIISLKSFTLLLIFFLITFLRSDKHLNPKELLWANNLLNFPISFFLRSHSKYPRPLLLTKTTQIIQCLQGTSSRHVLKLVVIRTFATATLKEGWRHEFTTES